MPATVFGGRGCMTRALWLRMYACACMHVIEDVDMHACLHARICVLREVPPKEVPPGRAAEEQDRPVHSPVLS